MLSPEAAFDVLTIVDALGDAHGGVTEPEVHLFDYLACLLSVYRGNPATEWGCRFIRSEWAAPFSLEIREAMGVLQTSGQIASGDVGWMLREQGKAFLEQMRTLSRMSVRMPFLEAACSSALAMPIGKIRAALHQEPTARSAATRRHAGALLAGPATETLYQQFAALSDALGVEISDLFVPSVTWLTYLERVERETTVNEVLADA